MKGSVNVEEAGSGTPAIKQDTHQTGGTPLEQRSVRELIKQLAEVEDAARTGHDNHRKAGTDLAQRAQAIVEALRSRSLEGTGRPGWPRTRRVRLAGRLDASRGNAVLHELLGQLAPGLDLEVDLSAVEAVEDAGAQILATARRQARALGGDLHLAATEGHPLLSQSAPLGAEGTGTASALVPGSGTTTGELR